MVDSLNTIDVLFNNHLEIPKVQPITEITSAEFGALPARVLIDPPQYGFAAVPGIKEPGGGKISFMASAAALKPMPKVSLNSAARAGPHSLMRTLAVELGEFGISISAVCPNFYARDDIYSQREFENNEKYRAAILRQIPLMRWSKERETPGLIRYLASPESDFITGKIISLSGRLV